MIVKLILALCLGEGVFAQTNAKNLCSNQVSSFEEILSCGLKADPKYFEASASFISSTLARKAANTVNSPKFFLETDSESALIQAGAVSATGYTSSMKHALKSGLMGKYLAWNMDYKVNVAELDSYSFAGKSPDRYYQTLSSIEASLPLLQGFGPNISSLYFDDLDNQIKLSEQTKKQALRDLVHKLSDSFFPYFAAKKKVEILSSISEQYSSELKMNKNLTKIGQASSISELLTAEKLAAIALEIKENEFLVQEYSKEICKFMSLQSCDLVGKIEPPKFAASFEDIADSDLEKAKDLDPDLGTARATIDSKDIQRKQAEDAVRSKLDLSVKYQTLSDYTQSVPGLLGTNGNVGSVSLQLIVPLDRSIQEASSKKARAELMSAKFLMTSLEQRKALDYRQRLQEIRMYSELIKLQKSSLEVSKEKLAKAIKARNLGLLSDKDIADFQNEIKLKEVQSVERGTKYMQLIADLKADLGLVTLQYNR